MAGCYGEWGEGVKRPVTGLRFGGGAAALWQDEDFYRQHAFARGQGEHVAGADRLRAALHPAAVEPDVTRCNPLLRRRASRGQAQDRIVAGHIRLNRRRVERSAQTIRLGDVLTLPAGERVLAIEILALPHRRGPSSEAQACYRTLDALAPFAIAPGQTAQTSGEPPL